MHQDDQGFSGEATFDRATYDTLAAALGAGPVGGMAKRFRIDLQQRFAPPVTPDALRRDAHSVTSAAGMLGFRRLSDAARTLERACATGADVDASLAALMKAREAADRCLAGLVQGDA